MKSNVKKRKATVSFDDQFHSYQHTTTPILHYDQISDSEGLRRAYEQGDYYVHGKTMFIAESHTARDWFDDITDCINNANMNLSFRSRPCQIIFKNVQ